MAPSKLKHQQVITIRHYRGERVTSYAMPYWLTILLAKSARMPLPALRSRPGEVAGGELPYRRQYETLAISHCSSRYYYKNYAPDSTVDCDFASAEVLIHHSS